MTGCISVTFVCFAFQLIVVDCRCVCASNVVCCKYLTEYRLNSVRFIDNGEEGRLTEMANGLPPT